MGVSALDDVMDHVKDQEMKKILLESKEKHRVLGDETHQLLSQYKDDVKEPNIMAKSMAWMKTNFEIAVNNSDKTIADLITDGCNMGVKSLNRYLNQYKAADEKSKDIAKRVINIEEKLALDLRGYL